MIRAQFCPAQATSVVPDSGSGSDTSGVRDMKADIHPVYKDVTVTCSCGNVIKTRSTRAEDFLVDVCSACHPFYTGSQKQTDTGGQIDKFKQRFGAIGSRKKA
jgi:large subunit ribosomal protein L31